MNSNIKLGKKLAKKYYKNNGVIVYSGTLAIESALVCAKIKKGDKVLISSTVCYAIFEAIVKLEAIPVIVIPKNRLVLTIDDIKETLKTEKIACIIVVHQYGIVHNVKPIREYCGNNMIIIEDVAQAWDIIDNNKNAGFYSDYVITSFGITKPLSLGYGGAIFSNHDLIPHFDFYDNASRESSVALIPYTYTNCDKIDILNLIKIGNNNVKKQRKIANLLSKDLKNNKNLFIISDKENNKSVWHRFPIFIDNEKYFKYVTKKLKECGIKYQLPHSKELYEITMVKNSNAIIKGNNKLNNSKMVLIRTRTNSEENIIKWLKLLEVKG